MNHPVDAGLGPAIWRLALELEWRTLLRLQGVDVLILEVVELRLADKHGVRGGDAVLVLGEALVLTEVLVTWLGDRERSATGLLRDSVVVGSEVEVLSVLDPAVPKT